MMNLVIPSNIDAEIALLGCIFLDESLIISVNDAISYTDFYDSKHKEIYKAMLDIYQDKKNIDITSLISYLNNNNLIVQVGGIEYINSIANFSYSTANFETYVNLVKEASLKRNTISALEKLTQEGYKRELNANDYLSSVESVIFELSKKRRTEEFSRIDKLTEKVKENTEKNFNSDGGITGLDTGFNNLNKLTLGFQKENLIILAARPAMGKSAMAMNLAVQVAENNKGGKAVVAIFSLEMGAEQLVERMIASEAQIKLNTLKKGNLSPQEWRLFANSTRKLSNLNLYFDDSSMITISDIRAKCRKLASEVGLDFVVIDYLQLIAGDEPGKSKQEEVSKISRSLKLMARELQIPVVALAQLSRDVEKRDDKKPIMADLRDSGSIEQDADIVTFLYRDDYYRKEKSDRPGEADLIISKNRSGSAGIELRYIFQGGFSRFVDNELEEGVVKND